MSYYDSAKPLTRQQLLDAIERVKAAPLEACGITKPHVLEPGGRVCWECGGLVR